MLSPSWAITECLELNKPLMFPGWATERLELNKLLMFSGWDTECLELNKPLLSPGWETERLQINKHLMSPSWATERLEFIPLMFPGKVSLMANCKFRDLVEGEYLTGAEFKGFSLMNQHFVEI